MFHFAIVIIIVSIRADWLVDITKPRQGKAKKRHIMKLGTWCPPDVVENISYTL